MTLVTSVQAPVYLFLMQLVMLTNVNNVVLRTIDDKFLKFLTTFMFLLCIFDCFYG